MTGKLIDSFINKNFSSEANILIFGSFIENNIKKSDIDILIISDLAPGFVKEVFWHGDTKFDVLVVPATDLRLCLEQDRQLRVYTDILKKAKIYREKNGFLTGLLSEVKASDGTQGIYLRKNTVSYQINTLFHELAACRSIYEADMYLYELSKNIMVSRLLDFNITNTASVKHISRFIKTHDPELLVTLYRLKKEFLKTQDFITIEARLRTIIGEGNLRADRAFSNQYILNAISGDELVFYIKNNDKLLKTLKRYLIEGGHRFYLFYVDINNIQPDGGYVVVKEQREVLEEKIVPDIEKLRIDALSFDSGKNLVFPFQLSIREHFGSLTQGEVDALDQFFITFSEFNNPDIIQKKRTAATFSFFFILREKGVLNEGNTVVLSDHFLLKASCGGRLTYRQTGYGLLSLKQKFQDFAIGGYHDLAKSANPAGLEGHRLNELAERFIALCGFVFKKQAGDQFAVVRMLLNIAGVKDFHKAYLFYLLTQKN